jgi:hypothetical protein
MDSTLLQRPVPTLDTLSDQELLKLWSRVMEELQERKVTRSANSPVADYAEGLVAKATGGTLQAASRAAFDVLGRGGERIQVKARRQTGNRAGQFSAIRKLPEHGFDFVVAVVFKTDLTIRDAWCLTWQYVKDTAPYVQHTNSWRLVIPRREVTGVVPVQLEPGRVLRFGHPVRPADGL